MIRLIRWGLRILFGLLILGLAVAVAGILLLDTLSRELLVRRLHAHTGLEVKVNAVHVGLLTPTVSIEGLKLYSPADFGGSACLDMPELHLEYDASALRSRQLHVRLLRLDLAEISVVVDKQGRNNFKAANAKIKEAASGPPRGGALKFTGIDVLNISMGKFHKTNLGSGKGEEIEFGITNQILRNVKTREDLSPLGLGAYLRRQTASKADEDQELNQLLDLIIKAP